METYQASWLTPFEKVCSYQKWALNCYALSLSYLLRFYFYILHFLLTSVPVFMVGRNVCQETEISKSFKYEIKYLFNAFMPVAPKTALLFWWYLSTKVCYSQKIYEYQMLITDLLTTILLQLFFQFKLIPKLIFNISIGPYDPCRVDLQALIG